MNKWQSLGLICASSILLILAYPQIEWWLLAWVALIPLLFCLEAKSYRAAFGLGWLWGFLFFFGTLGWFIYVTYPGAFLLISYLSIYPALFALAIIFFRKLSVFPRALILSALWVVLEFIRAHFLTGFGWASLGHSQYKNLWMIQCADITGIYGVSFMVILVNITLYETMKSLYKSTNINIGSLRMLQSCVIGFIFWMVCYGFYQTLLSDGRLNVKVAVIQPNIAQQDKWIAELKPAIIAKTLELTKRAAAENPDLIVWPETSLPGFWHENIYDIGLIRQTAKELNTAILIGLMTEENKQYFNSSVLIDSDGEIGNRYDKIHLVPFGEYLPFKSALEWARNIVGFEDFTPGKEYTLFNIAKNRKFGVLICFEDSVSYVRRNFTKQGADFLVNMTNDAWFEDTKAPFMHLQAAVFGAIENRRSIVRAANTGFSGFIDPYGRIIDNVHNQFNKKTFITGFAVTDIPINKQLTFYTKYGDVFTLLCY